MRLSVSIVVPAFDSANYLRESLPQLTAGSLNDLEIIVVDDGSTDETAVVARAFPVALLTVQERRGPAFARNLGAKAATG